MKYDIVNLTALRKPVRRVWKVFLHCSASDNPDHDYAKVINDWHNERGFDGIGYHFYVQKDGAIIEGRSLELIPAAQKDYNMGSIAICAGGLENFPAEQLASVKALCYTLDRLYKGGLSFHGHCEVNPGKTCPVYDYKGLLHLDDHGRMP